MIHSQLSLRSDCEVVRKNTIAFARHGGSSAWACSDKPPARPAFPVTA